MDEYQYVVKPYHMSWLKKQTFSTMQDALEFMDNIAHEQDCTLPTSDLKSIPHDFNLNGEIYFTFNLLKRPNTNRAPLRYTDGYFVVTCKKAKGVQCGNSDGN